ncbi:MAG TPA: DUF4097 family beta strand repeat-containing protein [Anaerolineales bacterium]
MSEERIERTFQVKLPARLSIGNIRGSVVVQPGEESGPGEGVISIIAVKHADTGNAVLTQIEIVQDANGGVRVSTHFGQSSAGFLTWLFSLGMNRPCKVDYTVRAPRSCSVSVDCVSSSASVEGLEGQFNLKTVSGALVMRRLSGSLAANTVSGEVRGQAVSGRADLHTVSGAVELVEADLPAVTASSVSGRMSLETTTLGPGPYHFNSVSGNVRLAIPSGAGCRIEMHKISGQLHTSLPVTYQKQIPGGETVEIQGGGPLVRFNTTSGSLDLAAVGGRQAVAASIPAVVAVSNSQEHRRQVLERIAHGDLSPEEGLKELDLKELDLKEL